MKSRIYGDKISIDPNQVNQFFEKRFYKDNPLASVMVRPGPDDGVAQKRNANETALVENFLQNREHLRVLDLGCGTGRWANNLGHKFSSYTGVDFTKSYIEAAKEIYAENKNYSFFNCSVTDIDHSIMSQEYDIVIINGLCVYLNDADVDFVFGYIDQLLTCGGLLYFRESVSIIQDRLTLKDYFSDELSTEYNAIYRTPDEYEAVLKNKLPNCAVSHSGYLLDESTGARAETNQKYWLLKKQA